MSVILTLHYPKSGIVQTQEYSSIHQAVTVAHAHFAAFPDGVAQISEAENQRVLMPYEELRGTFEQSKRREDTADAALAQQEDTVSGFFSRLFGARPSGEQAT